jgi:hypothetical protein
MLKAKKGFENTIIEYRVGQANIKIKVCDITPDHIEKAKYYCDLSAYVEEVQIVSEPEIVKPKRTRTKK